MGQLTEQLKTAKQALYKALEQRNDYETRLATVRTDKSLSAIERDREAEVIKSFIAVYEDDIEQARKDLTDAEVKMNEWLDTTVEQFDKNKSALQNEVADSLQLSTELNERVNLTAQKIRKMRGLQYSIEKMSELFSGDDKQRWKTVASQIDMTADSLNRDNGEAARVQIKLFD